MSYVEHPIYAKGRVVLRRRDNDDGTVVLYKPGIVRPDQIVSTTGTPGWDALTVDATFVEGKQGILRYTDGPIAYSISIETFMVHRFEKELNGRQYFVDQQWWDKQNIRSVDPIRQSPMKEPPAAPPPIGRLTFGNVLPCTRCKTTGQEPGKKQPCAECLGNGFIRRSNDGQDESHKN